MKGSKEILTPDDVASLMPHSISKPWIVAHWVELGGTDIAGRKLIIKSVLYDNLQSDQKKICQGQEIKIHFFKDGDFFRIGEGKKALSFKCAKGLLFIQFLLKYPGKAFSPIEVYHHGEAQPIDNWSRIIDQFGLDKSIKIARFNEKDRVKFQEYIEEIKASINDVDDPETILEKKQNLKMLEDLLKNNVIRDPRSPREKARINVQKAIKRSLDNIKKKNAAMKRYLNDNTIKTGDWCCYEPLPKDQVEWILYPK